MEAKLPQNRLEREMQTAMFICWKNFGNFDDGNGEHEAISLKQSMISSISSNRGSQVKSSHTPLPQPNNLSISHYDDQSSQGESARRQLGRSVNGDTRKSRPGDDQCRPLRLPSRRMKISQKEKRGKGDSRGTGIPPLPNQQSPGISITTPTWETAVSTYETGL